MACMMFLARVLIVGVLISTASLAQPREISKPAGQKPGLSLVRVNMITTVGGTMDAVEINGRLISDYSPIIAQVFSTTGIVLDQRGYIMTFLGYRWVDVQDRDPRIEVTTEEGQKWKGILVGIDQNNGVAVIRLLGSNLKKTPVCAECGVKHGSIVMTPVARGTRLEQLREARVVSVGDGEEIQEQGRWTLTVSQPFPDIGQPILNSDQRVIGFIASQDPEGVRAVIYPISQLLSSADKIIRKGGSIQVGWLGAFVQDAKNAGNHGIGIQGVVPGGPAQKSGLAASDFLVGFDGHKIKNSLQFIQLVQSTPIGSKINLEILREGNPMTLTAVVEPFKPQPLQGKLAFNLPGFEPPAVGSLRSAVGAAAKAGVLAPSPEDFNPRPLVGLDTIVLNPSLAEALQIPTKQGLLVVDVQEQSPADLAGILVGDIVIGIDGRPIKDLPGFSSYLQTLGWGAHLSLKVLRKGVEQSIPIQLPAKNTPGN
jgi:S1-C subfamily serine protease